MEWLRPASGSGEDWNLQSAAQMGLAGVVKLSDDVNQN